MPKPLYQSLKNIGRSTALALAVFEMVSSRAAYGQNITGDTSDDDIFTFLSIIDPSLPVTLSQGGSDTLTIGVGESLASSSNVAATLFSNGGSGLNLTNGGTIRNLAGGNQTDAILIQNGTGIVSINNTGLIQTAANNNAGGTAIGAAIQVFNSNGLTSFSLTNAGTVSSVRQAVRFGATGNPMDVPSSLIINQAGGLIEANSGMVAGVRSEAVFLGNGTDTVVNEAGATIRGEISLFGGDDTLTNSGLITGTPLSNSSADGLVVINSGLDRITNNATGRIEATGADRTAIRVDAEGSGGPADAIINAGTVIATAEAIFVDDPGTDLTGGIVNLAGGQIIGDSDNSGIGLNGNSAVRVSAAMLTGGLDNAGLIEHSTGFGVALEGSSADVAGGITNSGTITGGVFGITIDSAQQTGDLINSGTITGVANSGLSVSGASSDVSGAVTNLAGGVISGGGNGIRISSFGQDLSGGITNSGTISGTLAGGRGIAVVGSSGNDISGGVTNQSGGVISGVAAGVLVGSGQNISGGLTNVTGGEISGDTAVSVGRFAAISGGIVNSGTLEGNGGTAIAFEVLSQQTPITIAGGRIVGDVTDSNAARGFSPVTVTGSGFRTEGDFTVSDLVVNAGQDFTIRAGDTVNLDTQSASGGTLRFEVGATADARLNVTGAGNGVNLTGSTVEAVVDPARALAAGDEILIGTGGAAVVGFAGAAGQALTAVTDNSLLFDFSIADGGQGDILTSTDDTELFFQIAQGALAADNALTPNGSEAGAAVDALAGTTDPELAQVLAQTGMASDASQLEEVLQATLPQIDRSSFLVSQQLTQNTVRLVSDRLTVIRDHGGVLGGALESWASPDELALTSFLDDAQGDEARFDSSLGIQPWGQFFVQDIDQETRGTVVGFDATGRGFTVGIDTGNLDDQAIVGAAVSYADTNVRSSGANRTRTDIDSVNLTVYGDYDLNRTDYLVGDLGFTYGRHNATRFDVGGVAGLNADSEFDTYQFQARLIAARDYEREDGSVITPKAEVRYVYLETGSFSETGAGGAGLRVDNAGVNVLEFGVGLDLRKDFFQDDGSVISPELSAGYRYDVIGEAVETTSSFIGGGPAFVSQGADPDRGTLNLGAAVGYTSPGRWEWSLSYDYEVRGDLQAHSAHARLAIPF